MTTMDRTPNGPRSIGGHDLNCLTQGWVLLHLSVEAPERIPGWDVVILTAASERQADLYRPHLDAARRRGLIGEHTLTLVVADPEGRRIGSGGATLNALRPLCEAKPDSDIGRLRVLLIHAGGDSRRAPWANIFGKPFIPFPLLADADRAVPTLFDNLLALAAPAALALKEGGLYTLSGDVLPLFAASQLKFPTDGGLVVTTPVSLDVAERHGVIVSRGDGRVVRLLQKAPAEELVRAGALVGGGAALLDTGIYGFTGNAYRALVDLSREDPDPVAELLGRGEECSLYEEIAAGMVPSRYGWLAGRPLGKRLIEALEGEALVQHRVDDLIFVHFGSTGEVLQHLGGLWQGRLSRRICAECGPAVAASATVCGSLLAPGAQVGGGSLIHGCRLGNDVRIGRRCVVIGVDATKSPFRLPDNTCLWQVPLASGAQSENSAVVTACCGADDNPKHALDVATFCNRSLMRWLVDHGVEADELWEEGEERTLWTARLFPVDPDLDGLSVAEWMLGDGSAADGIRDAWRRARRIGHAGLHSTVDASAFLHRQEEVTAGLILRAIGEAVEGVIDRNVDALASQVSALDLRKKFLDLAGRVPKPGTREEAATAPASRLFQVRADLMQAAGCRDEGERLAARAFAAVQEEVARAVRPYTPEPVRDLPMGDGAVAELPVRFDVAGGWSDTPPYCLERPARVLNLAISLDGALPLGASVEALSELKWELVLEDLGRSVTIRNGGEVAAESNPRDPFTLLRTALVLSGYGSAEGITQGMRVKTWSRVPKGSGLGASSILGAALITALQRLAGRPDDACTVSDLVLVLEQRMTTGGGWQDQIGGIVPGVKCTTSVPVKPLRLTIEPVPLLPQAVEELHRRLVIAFTGQERLAKNILQIVVGRCLRRDARALAAIERLVELAGEGRRSLALGDIDGLGLVMAEAWRVHQELDPHCSNPWVDAIYREVEDFAVGAKLAGAGGGGFMGVLAKDEGAANRTREVLSALGRGVRVYDWALWTG